MNPVQPAELVRFLELYAEHFNFRRACAEIGRNHTTIYRALQSNKEFKQAFDETRGIMGLIAESAAFERGVEGVEQTHLTKDGREYTTHEYSDALLALILKSRGAGYSDRLEITNPDGSLGGASDMQIAARIASILAVAQARKDRGEIIDAEIVEPAVPALSKPGNEDLV